jgi:hypothetical protein
MTDSATPQAVELRWTESAGAPRGQPAEVQSLDRNTMRLAVSEFLPFGQTCEIAFGGSVAALLPPIRAAVRDVRPLTGEGYRVTCQFAEPLADDVLRSLADAGCFNRRANERRPVGLEIQARRELSQGQADYAVRVADLSAGGCCLISPQEVPSGYRIMLSAEGEAGQATAIPLRVQWQQPAGDHFLLGCSFCQPAGYQQLAAQALEQSVPSDGSPAPRLLDRVFVLALSAVGLSAAATTSA